MFLYNKAIKFRESPVENEEKFMRLALIQAMRAKEKDEVPVGAVLVIDGKVVAKAHNQAHKKKNALYHAEMICLHKAAKKIGDFRLTEATLYTTLEPCIMCFGALTLSRIKRVVYGAVDLRHGAHLFIPFHHPIHNFVMKGGLLEEPSRILLQSFFQERRHHGTRDSGAAQSVDRSARKKTLSDCSRSCRIPSS